MDLTNCPFRIGFKLIFKTKGNELFITRLSEYKRYPQVILISTLSLMRTVTFNVDMVDQQGVNTFKFMLDRNDSIDFT